MYGIERGSVRKENKLKATAMGVDRNPSTKESFWVALNQIHPGRMKLTDSDTPVSTACFQEEGETAARRSAETVQLHVLYWSSHLDENLNNLPVHKENK